MIKENRAIVFSMSAGTEESATEAIEFMKNNPILAWGTNSKIDTGKFNPSKSNPLVGYINYQSYVRYEVLIEGIKKFDKEVLYPEQELIPSEWKNARWKTFFYFSQIKEIENPIKTTEFIKINGEPVKNAPQDYVAVRDHLREE